MGIFDLFDTKRGGGGGGDTLGQCLDGTITAYSNDTVTSVNPYTFQNCTALESVSLPNVSNVEKRTFGNCVALSDLVLDYKNIKSIDDDAFLFTDALNMEMKLPSLTRLGRQCFGMSGITKLDLGKKEITGCVIEDLAFCGSQLNCLILRYGGVATLQSVDGDALIETPIESGTGYIYVLDSLVNSYKTATNWSTYAAQIKPLSEIEPLSVLPTLPDYDYFFIYKNPGDNYHHLYGASSPLSMYVESDNSVKLYAEDGGSIYYHYLSSGASNWIYSSKYTSPATLWGRAAGLSSVRPVYMPFDCINRTTGAIVLKGTE